MKAPSTSLFAILLATALAAGCTVNIHTRPDSDPGPEPAESDSEVGQVEPTNRRERVEPIPDPRRRTDDEVVVRRREEPTAENPTTKTKDDPKTKDETKAKDDSKTKETGRREKDDTNAQPPVTKADPDPPDRPGEGKGRKESQETYPGKGKATGLDKQQDRDERTNPGNAKGRSDRPDVEKDPVATKQTAPDGKPEEKPGNGKAKDEQVVGKQPEAKKDPVVKEEAGKPNQKPDNDKASKDPVVTKPAPDTKPDQKPVDNKAQSNSPDSKQRDANKDPAATKQENTKSEPARRNDGGNAQKGQKESQPAAPEPDSGTPETNDSNGNPPVRLGIQSKNLPSPGQCRVWIPGAADKDQAKSRNCSGIEATAPTGAWVLYRPQDDKKVVHVKQMDQQRRGAVSNVWVYEVSSGKYLRADNSK